jgi:hypothetical protein
MRYTNAEALKMEREAGGQCLGDKFSWCVDTTIFSSERVLMCKCKKRPQVKRPTPRKK